MGVFWCGAFVYNLNFKKMPRKKSTPKKNWTPKKRFAGRRMRKKAIPGINYSRHRITTVTPINTTATQAEFNVVIAWQNTAIPGNVPKTREIGFNQSARWLKVSPNWDQYAITGLKIEWLPRQSYPRPTDPYLTALWSASTADNYDTIQNAENSALAQAPGFKAMNTQRPWRKFISLKKLSKQQNVAWQDNSKYNVNEQNGLTKAGTIMRFFISNPAAVTWGTVKCTWYVKMRG